VPAHAVCKWKVEFVFTDINLDPRGPRFLERRGTLPTQARCYPLLETLEEKMFHQSPLAILPHLPYHARPFDTKGKFQPIDLECTSRPSSAEKPWRQERPALTGSSPTYIRYISIHSLRRMWKQQVPWLPSPNVALMDATVLARASGRAGARGGTSGASGSSQPQIGRRLAAHARWKHRHS